MDLPNRTTTDTRSLLKDLLTARFDPDVDRARYQYDCNVYIAPYGPNGIPRPQDLHVARACELSGNHVCFYFPLAFTKDLLAIRIGDGQGAVDVCGKILNQSVVETQEFGPTNLVECRFVGRLFLG